MAGINVLENNSFMSNRILGTGMFDFEKVGIVQSPLLSKSGNPNNAFIDENHKFYSGNVCQQIYINPVGSGAVQSIATNTQASFDFQISGSLNIQNVRSCRLQCSITNSSEDTDLYVTPLFCMNEVSSSFSGGGASIQSVENRYSHLAWASRLTDTDFKSMYLQDELGVDINSGNGGGIDFRTAGFIPDSVVLWKSPATLPKLIIPFGQTRILEQYVVYSVLTANGFIPCMLDESQKLTIRVTFNQGTSCFSDPSIAVINSLQLNITGSTPGNLAKSKINEVLRKESSQIVLSWYRPSIQYSQPAQTTANSDSALSMPQLSGAFAGITCFQTRAQPTTLGVENFNGVGTFFQDLQQQEIEVDTVAQVVTVGNAYQDGTSYGTNSNDFILDGSTSFSSWSLNQHQMEDYSYFSSSDMWRGPAPKCYFPYIYTFPFSCNLNKSIYRKSPSAGLVGLKGGSSWKYRPVSTKAYNVLQVAVGFQYCEAIYKFENGQGRIHPSPFNT